MSHQARRPKRHWGSGQLTLQRGRVGFHFTGTACHRRTPVEIGYGKSEHRERTRQDGRALYRKSPTCRTRTVFFVNHAAILDTRTTF